MNKVSRPDQHESKLQPLLLTRQQTAELLGGISVDLVKILEREGRLKPVRLRAKGMVFYAMSQVQALAEQGLADA